MANAEAVKLIAHTCEAYLWDGRKCGKPATCRLVFTHGVYIFPGGIKGDGEEASFCEPCALFRLAQTRKQKRA